MGYHRDILSELPDDFLVKILSYLPTKDVVVTSLLSKRWCFLWRLVPRLSYDFSHHSGNYLCFARFVNRSLLLHKPLVLESMHIKIGRRCLVDVDFRIWLRTAVERGVRELSISLYKDPITLPKSLSTSTTLVVLKLENISLLDMCSYVCFQLLKTLHLVDVKYLNEESLHLLLSNCFCLEDLVLQRCPGDNLKVVTIALPCLHSLSIQRSAGNEDYGGFLINVPSLKRLNLEDNCSSFCSIEDMSELVEANIDVFYDNTDKLMNSLTSAKRLSLCLVTADTPYPSGSIFSQLVQLVICPCSSHWCDLLCRLVHDSPNLRFLKVHHRHNIKEEARWKRPVSVPNCFLSHLETFEWEKYEGTKVQKKVAIYVLRHAICLKKAIFAVDPSISLQEKHEMLKHLATLPRGSTTCELFFD